MKKILKNKKAENDTKVKYFTRGGQIVFHNLRMLFQINAEIVKFHFIALIILSILCIYFITPKEVLMDSFFYGYSQFQLLLLKIHFPIKTFIVQYHGRNYLENGVSFLSQWEFTAEYKQIYGYALLGFSIAFFASCFISFCFVKWLTTRGKEQASSKFLRGIELEDQKIVKKNIIKNKMASDLNIDGFPLIKNSEVQHILIHGTTGAGKGQTLQKLLDCIRQREDRVILYDKGCSFTPIYYRENKDILLNPFDQRCDNWDLWTESLTDSDFENIAESLIPLQNENDPFWINAARTIFASAAFKMRNDPKRSIDKLLNLLMTASLTELENYLSGTQAATLVSDKIEKTATSIRSVISAYLKSLRFLTQLDKKDNKKFSIRHWIQNEKNDNHDQWLFISSNGEQHASMRPLISMWLSQASLSLLSLPENRDRRIWFIVDELPSLHRLPQLPETIAEVRKFGGCFVLGMQSFAQLEKTYGRNQAREIFDLLNTRFFFRNPSSDMAKLVSSELGAQEIEDMREQYSYGADHVRDGISIGRQKNIQSLVTYSEIINLPDMQCFLRLPSNYPVVKLTLQLETRPTIAPHFLPINQAATENIASVNKIHQIDNEEIFQDARKKSLRKKEISKSTMNSDGLMFE